MRDRLRYGGDYNPEQWPREVWQEDVRLMAQAHVNTVTVGVFSWSSLEPCEGTYTFEWLDEVMDLMHRHGIRVVLATPTASPPPWFSLAHPEALPQTPEGVQLVHGSRDTYNSAAPAYREASVRIARALAERYGAHPALEMWHVHNEYGTVSHGPASEVAFRDWLRARYGTVEHLNTVWNTAFWSQGYARWDEVSTPRATQYLHNPAHVLDFKRFTADMLREHLRSQVEVVRRASPGVPVTTNFMLPTWCHYDPWAMAGEIDQVSVDHYLDDHGPAGEVHAAFGADLARSFNGGRPWMLMEQATSLVYDYAGARMLVKEPGRMLRNTLQYLARGADGSLFFQWRSPRVGAEFFHSAMVPHVGPDSRIFREVVELGETLERLAPLAVAPDGPVNEVDVAIVWSADAWWATQTPMLPSGDLDFLPAVRRVHTALWELGVLADVVDPDADLSRYRVVLVPSLIAVSDAQATRFADFVAAGGHLVAWYLAGTTDEGLSVRPGSYGAALAELLGVRVEEHFPQPDGALVELDDGSRADGWAENVELRGAEVVARYRDGVQGASWLAGPAVTRHQVAAGTAHYVSTRLDAAALRSHLGRVLEGAGVGRTRPEAGDGLEIVPRRAGSTTYLFVLNHGTSARRLTLHGEDLLTGRQFAGPVEVAPGDSLVVAERA